MLEGQAWACLGRHRSRLEGSTTTPRFPTNAEPGPSPRPARATAWALAHGQPMSRAKIRSPLQNLSDTQHRSPVPQMWGTVDHSLGSVTQRAWHIMTRDSLNPRGKGAPCPLVSPSRWREAPCIWRKPREGSSARQQQRHQGVVATLSAPSYMTKEHLAALRRRNQKHRPRIP